MRNFLQIILLLILFIFVRNEEENESQLQEEKLNTEEEEEDQAEEFAQENFVYVLKDTNFDEFIKKHPTTLVEFYAPWCGHCKQLAPEYEKAAEEMADTVPLAKVDATVEKELAKRFKIMGFPSIYLFKEGQTEPTAFNGDREAEGIVQWLKEKTDPNYKPPPEEVVALTREAFDEFVGNKPIMLVEFYAPWCGHCKKLAPEYENAAKKLKIRLAVSETTTTYKCLNI